MKRNTSKRAFTLVELLVVIAVIGILVGLLVPAIGASLNRTAEFANQTDIDNLNRALEQFNSDFGFYPPDISEITSAPEFLPWLNLISRDHQEGNGRDGGGLQIWWNEVGQFLTPESSLVFWLSGLGQDATRPLTVADPASRGTRVVIPAFNADATGSSGPITVRRNVRFDFPGDQLVINGTTAAFVQARTSSPQPYLYFDSSSYDTFLTGNNIYGNASGRSPYHLAGVVPEESRESYQIVSAGLDGEFGLMGDLSVSGNRASDNDNLCNFVRGNNRLEVLLLGN